MNEPNGTVGSGDIVGDALAALEPWRAAKAVGHRRWVEAYNGLVWPSWATPGMPEMLLEGRRWVVFDGWFAPVWALLVAAGDLRVAYGSVSAAGTEWVVMRLYRTGAGAFVANPMAHRASARRHSVFVLQSARSRPCTALRRRVAPGWCRCGPLPLLPCGSVRSVP